MVNTKGGAVFGAALLRPRLRARLIKVVQEKVKAKGGAIFGCALLRPRLRARLIMVVQETKPGKNIGTSCGQALLGSLQVREIRPMLTR